jgi:flagellar basal-body rod protein FlgF
MLNSEYVSLSRQEALRVQMDVVANNLANMNTTAYKGEHTLFQEYLVTTDTGENVSYVQDWGLVLNTDEGPTTVTGNPLDVAIQGKGYFVVDTPEGEQYTRNGHFTTDQQGRLISSAGNLVLDDSGQPIQFTELDENIQIAQDGTISTDAGVVARLNIVTFENEQLLKKAGNSQYSTDQDPNPALDSTVHQGLLESSNVQPILEITDLIRIQRAYQSNQRLANATDELQKKMLQDLGRVA